MIERLATVSFRVGDQWQQGVVIGRQDDGLYVVGAEMPDHGRRHVLPEAELVDGGLVAIVPCGCSLPRGFRCGHGNGGGVVVPLHPATQPDDVAVAGGHR